MIWVCSKNDVMMQKFNTFMAAVTVIFFKDFKHVRHEIGHFSLMQDSTNIISKIM